MRYDGPVKNKNGAKVNLIDPAMTDFDAIRSDFKWAIPERLNIAYQVCELNQSDPERIAIYYENAQGVTASFGFGQLKTW